VVLCNDAGWLASDKTCQVCTHDKFEDHRLRTSIELVTVFPGVGSIRRALKSYKDESLCFEAVFACHHAVDPLGIAMEVLSKFGADCKYIQAVHFLVDLPKEALRKYDTIAYRIVFRSSFSGETKLFWKRPSGQLDEILFPKHVLNHEEITNLLNDNQGSLKCHSQRRNGCFDIEGGHNYESLSFRPGSIRQIIRRIYMRLFIWQEELRKKAQRVQFKPSTGLTGKMVRKISSLRNPCYFADILIT